MRRIKLPSYDLWTKGTDGPPASLRHVCSYDLNLVVDPITESIFLRRLRTIDELWVVTDLI